MLDRLDSVCFSAPIFFHLTRYFFTACVEFLKKLESLASWPLWLDFVLRLPRASRQIVLVQSLPHQRLDDCLTAHIEVVGRSVKLLQHGCSEVHIDALDRLNHAALTLEETGDVLPLIS
jgi:hypothetical protein